MNAFVIPQELKEKLDENRAYTALVDRALSDFGIWLGRNKTIFFTEYTDHSLNHIQNVLGTANDLIREQCREIITPADVATLILSALIHDSAMHIDIDGFITLVQSENQQIIGGFGDKSWKVMWLDFLAESRRFSGRKLMALFGDTEPIRHPPMNPKEMNLRDLLLCGEFLRRHHHRLAHEIAIFGVPSYLENNLKFEKTEDTEHIIDLAGVIARSHGLSIRDCFDYLKNEYANVKLVRGVHPVYIMALLRISDILQIQPERAPQQIQKVSKFNSPVSLAEWEMHQAIKDVVFNDPPETILVVADPKNVKTYLRIRKLLDQIQSELDNSWTIIGEVYSYDNKFREFGLTIRRVRSNIDDVEQFSKRVQYLPVHASFEVADTDLLKLLIAPLYGDDPAIGVRELVQNAIDAVRELEEYQKQRQELKNIELPDHEGDVLVSIDQDQDKKWWITVSDKGIGMTPDTLREYFLKAGASLRRSEIWKSTFEDEEGKSRVLRSGRFGIGALATFLLGDDIYVSSRHVTEKSGEGIQFQTQLDTESIEFQRIKRPIGTTIRVQISEEKAEVLKERDYSWNWYYLDKPVVERRINGSLLEKNTLLPNVNSDLPNTWRRVLHKDYADIHWSYSSGRQLVVNGIQVCGYNFEYESRFRDDIDFVLPEISVFDFDARLPLNLQRTELTSSIIPFEKELFEDILRDFIAFILVNGPTKALPNKDVYEWFFRYHYRGARREIEHYLSVRRPLESYWYSTFDGFGLNQQWSINHLKPRTAIEVISDLNLNAPNRKFGKANFLPIKIQPGQIALGYADLPSNTLDKKVIKMNGTLKKLTLYGIANPKSISRHYSIDVNDLIYRRGVRIILSRNIINLLKEAETHSSYSGFKPFWENESIDIGDIEEWSNEEWVLWRIGDCDSNQFDFVKFAEENKNPNDNDYSCILAERYYWNEQPKPDSLAKLGYWPEQINDLLKHENHSKLEKTWMDLLGSPVIPLNMNTRREKFADAYKELKIYIEAHEAMKNEKSESDLD